MFQFHLLYQLLFLLTIHIFSTQVFSTKICGTHPWTYRCPINQQCDTNVTRLCLTESHKLPIAGLVFLIVVPVIIILIILRVCIPCCRSKYKDETSSDLYYQGRSGAAVCATQTLRA